MPGDVFIYNEVDDIFRVKECFDSDASSSFVEIRHLADTEQFTATLQDITRKYETLETVVKNLWATHQYNQEYISFLLGGYSKKEFKEIANRFAVHMEICDNPHFIRFASDLISNTLDQNISTSDISLLLNIEMGCINNTALLEFSTTNNEIE
jgi:hypothetical protein